MLAFDKNLYYFKIVKTVRIVIITLIYNIISIVIIISHDKLIKA